jgi:hypothetical protein
MVIKTASYLFTVELMKLRLAFLSGIGYLCGLHSLTKNDLKIAGSFHSGMRHFHQLDALQMAIAQYTVHAMPHRMN